MRETSRTVTNFKAILFVVHALHVRKSCRINISIGKRVKITVLEDGDRVLGQELETP